MVLSSQDGTNSTTTTASNGSFSFPVDSTKLVNASITIPMNQTSSSRLIVTNDTVYNCSDTATNQPPPFTLSAQVPSNGKTCSGICMSLPQLPVCCSTCLAAPDEFVTSTIFTNALNQLQGMGLSCEAALCASAPALGPATCVLPHLLFIHMVMCVLSALYAAACAVFCACF